MQERRKLGLGEAVMSRAAESSSERRFWKETRRSFIVAGAVYQHHHHDHHHHHHGFHLHNLWSSNALVPSSLFLKVLFRKHFPVFLGGDGLIFHSLCPVRHHTSSLYSVLP